MSNIVERNNGTGTLCEGVVNGRAGVNVGHVRSISCKILQKKFKLRIASLNVGTMDGRASEIVETLARRRIDICAVQETRWRGCSTRMITGKHCRYKFLWSGDTSGFGGVGILVAEKWAEKTISVDRTSSRQMSFRLLIGRKILYIISYAPQSGLSESEKDTGGNDIILAITHVINCIITENKITDDWCLSYIINCYKGKGDALLRGNYRGLKLLDQVMKVMEHILATIIRTQVDINAMQFGFMCGRGTPNVIFILQVQYLYPLSQQT